MLFAYGNIKNKHYARMAPSSMGSGNCAFEAPGWKQQEAEGEPWN
jgi:hypothetical protein